MMGQLLCRDLAAPRPWMTRRDDEEQVAASTSAGRDSPPRVAAIPRDQGNRPARGIPSLTWTPGYAHSSSAVATWRPHHSGRSRTQTHSGFCARSRSPAMTSRKMGASASANSKERIES